MRNEGLKPSFGLKEGKGEVNSVEQAVDNQKDQQPTDEVIINKDGETTTVPLATSGEATPKTDTTPTPVEDANSVLGDRMVEEAISHLPDSMGDLERRMDSLMQENGEGSNL